MSATQKKAAEPMLRVGDVVDSRHGIGKVIRIDRTTRRYDKYGNDVQEVTWADVKDGYVVVDMDNGHWQYGQDLSPVQKEE